MIEFKVFTDGACRGNPGPSSIGVAVYDLKGDEIYTLSESIGVKTNNQAEYLAVLKAFKFLKEKEADAIHLFSDSQLLVRQMTGVYKIKNPDLREIFKQIKALESFFKKVTFTHVPREENKRADELANQALDRF